MAKENKDQMINLRVPRAVYKKIREFAEENRDTVSNVVRKAIEDNLTFIAEVSSQVLNNGKFQDVVGYASLKAARPLICDKCRSAIKTGEGIALGETQGARKYVFCGTCAKGFTL